jgi:LPS-assembly protein
MSLRRSDVSLTGTFGALTTTVNWAYLRTPKSVYDFINSFDPTLLTSYPYLLQSERSELQGTASLKLSQNWRVFGGARYDLRNRFVISDMGGIGYDNDSFSASLSYSTTTSQTLTAALTPGRMQTDQVVYFKFGFRTLGDGSISNGTSANSNSANSTATTR